MSDQSLLNRRQFLARSSGVGARQLLNGATAPSPGWLKLQGRQITIQISHDLSLAIHRRDGNLLWRTSERLKPEFSVAKVDTTQPARRFELATATQRATKLIEGPYRGHRIQLSGFSGVDIGLELVLALDAATDELLVEVGQNGGRDRVSQVNHLYRIEKPTVEGGYMVLPHGCGYLIPATMTQELTGKGIIGYRFTLPLFGMVKSNHGFYQIVETYWDCEVGAEHVPRDYSALDFNWLPSLGELRYVRRFRWRFADGTDYVAMAKAYRGHARTQGLLHTLEDKSKELPAIHKYVSGIEYRWSGWRSADRQRVLADITKLKEYKLNVNFFFPKWSSTGYPDEKGYEADAGWQAYLRDEPVREGWQGLAQCADEAKSIGAVLKLMINPNSNFEGAPEYDPSKAPVGEASRKSGFPQVSLYYSADITKRALDHALSKGLKFDAFYFDGYSAHSGHGEDLSPQHPVSRRLGFENQVLSFRETRRHGIIPGAELPRFWSVGECAFFFFDTGWSADLLPVGEPIPLFQLVFHDCYTACFSGGGYGRYDWPRDKNPRLYELLLGTGPGYNWMLPYVDGFPGLGLQGGVPIQQWGEDRMRNRVQWLCRWSAYYQAIALSEMISHEFLNSELTLQRVRFANGVSADFDMAKGLCRINNVGAFTGHWEPPHEGSL